MQTQRLMLNSDEYLSIENVRRVEPTLPTEDVSANVLQIIERMPTGNSPTSIPDDVSNILDWSTGLIEGNVSEASNTLHIIKNREVLNSNWNDISIFERFNNSQVFSASIARYKNKLREISSPDRYITDMSDESRKLIESIIRFVKISDGPRALEPLTGVLTSIQVSEGDLCDFQVRCACNLILYSVPVFLTPLYFGSFNYDINVLTYAPFDVVAHGLQTMCQNIQIDNLSWLIRAQARLEGYLPNVQMYTSFYQNVICPTITKINFIYTHPYQHITLGLLKTTRLAFPLLLGSSRIEGLIPGLTRPGYWLTDRSVSTTRPDIPLIVGTVGENDENEGLSDHVVQVIVDTILHG